MPESRAANQSFSFLHLPRRRTSGGESESRAVEPRSDTGLQERGGNRQRMNRFVKNWWRTHRWEGRRPLSISLRVEAAPVIVYPVPSRINTWRALLVRTRSTQRWTWVKSRPSVASDTGHGRQPKLWYLLFVAYDRDILCSFFQKKTNIVQLCRAWKENLSRRSAWRVPEVNSLVKKLSMWFFILLGRGRWCFGRRRYCRMSGQRVVAPSEWIEPLQEERLVEGCVQWNVKDFLQSLFVCAVEHEIHCQMVPLIIVVCLPPQA